ncbi:MAG: sugar-transfer associated ATP-grasp domain-containing protein [Bacilli bacterium]|nr:sugar-transfer associated ATP-grasp domain-containing protein [Bacilli bacterium]
MKLKYLFKRFYNMDFKNMFSTINKVESKTHKSKIVIFFDIIYCGFKYQAGYSDYYLFEMYKMNRKERKTVVTRGVNNSLIKFFNNAKYCDYFRNKVKFNQRFDKYLNRKWLYLNEYDEFIDFIKPLKEIIVKPIDGTCGKKIEKITIKNKDYNELFNYLKTNNLLLIEEVIKQHDKLNKLHPTSINTIRIVTIAYQDKATILTAFLRIGNGKVVDNFNSGGMVAPVNIKTGIIHFPALDKDGHLYKKHPLTNINIIDFKVPYFKEAKELCMRAALEIPEIRMIGFDVAITPDGPVLVEGNEFPGHDIYQLPPHRKGNIGLLPDFEKSLKEIGVTKKMLDI